MGRVVLRSNTKTRSIPTLNPPFHIESLPLLAIRLYLSYSNLVEPSVKNHMNKQWQKSDWRPVLIFGSIYLPAALLLAIVIKWLNVI